ncbi:MAG TPA: hypothetical protein VIW21_09340 [Chthoniobacterales bacterium]
MTSHQPTKLQFWIATIAVILAVIAVWKYIDYRTQPPPPPNKVAAPSSQMPSPQSSP